MGIGSSYHQLQDPAVSPMRYGGQILHATLGWSSKRQTRYRSMSISTDLGQLRSRNATEQRPMATQYTQVDIRYGQWWSMPRLTSGWLIGAAVRSHNSVRITPQNDTGMISFLIANGLWVGMRRKHLPRSHGQRMYLDWQLAVPLLQHVLRPSYLNLYNYIDPEHNWLQERLAASEWRLWHRFPGLETNLSLHRVLQRGNEVALMYQWSFYHYADARRVNAAQHTLRIQLGIAW